MDVQYRLCTIQCMTKEFEVRGEEMERENSAMSRSIQGMTGFGDFLIDLEGERTRWFLGRFEGESGCVLYFELRKQRCSWFSGKGRRKQSLSRDPLRNVGD